MRTVATPYRDQLIDQMVNDPNYDIHPNGVVISRVSGRAHEIEVKSFRTDGRKTVSYGVGNVHLSIARIVYRKYIGPLDPKMYVCYKNGDKFDIRPENLEQVTMKEFHRRLNKIPKKYTRPLVHPGYKLTPEIVLMIRGLYETGMKQVEIGILFGVGKPQVHNIVKRKSWKHI